MVRKKDSIKLRADWHLLTLELKYYFLSIFFQTLSDSFMPSQIEKEVMGYL